VIWVVGVAASPLCALLGTPPGRAGCVQVHADLTLPDDAQVYVIGDLAAATSRSQSVPSVSPAAEQMGHSTAANILRTPRGEPRQAFVHRDYDTLAAIGRRGGGLSLLQVVGIPGVAHLALPPAHFLIGCLNGLMLRTDWACAFATFQHSARGD
jgi:NADH dehydrogenase